MLTADRLPIWEQRRPLIGARVLRTTLRTAHLIASGMLYGGHIYNISAERLWPALIATILTGGAFVALEVFHAPVWLVQLRGISAMVKIALLAAVSLCWSYRVWLLTAVMVIGGISSHMPGRYRYYSVIHGRVVGGRESG